MGRYRAIRSFRLAMLGLLALLLAGCDVDLYSHLDERDANEMMAVLLQHGINANRKLEQDRSITISVPKAEFAQAVDLLKDRGYPRDKYATVADVFPGDKLISSPLQERARLNYALSQELAHTISEIDGVLSARVHIVLPEDAEMQKAAVASSASVFIRHLRSAALQSSVPQIKTLVANSIAGVAYDKVTVVLVPVEAAPVPQPVAGAGSAKVSSLLQGQNAPNTYWAIGALGVLAVVGSGAVVRRRYTAQRTTVKLDAA